MYDRYTIVRLFHVGLKDNPTDDYARIGSYQLRKQLCEENICPYGEYYACHIVVPNNLLKKFSVQNMRISLMAVRNPFVITGWDYLVIRKDGDTTLRTVNFGVNFTL